MTIEKIFGSWKVAASFLLIVGLDTLIAGVLVLDWSRPFAAVLFTVTGWLWAWAFSWLVFKHTGTGTTIEQLYGSRKVAAFFYLIVGLGTAGLGMLLIGVDWPRSFAVSLFAVTIVLWAWTFSWLVFKHTGTGTTIEQLYGSRKYFAFIFLIAGLGTLFNGVEHLPRSFAAVDFAITGWLWAFAVSWLVPKLSSPMRCARN
jgi:hypothetical protein